MKYRHEKEAEQLLSYHQKQLDDLEKKFAWEKKELPKVCF